MRLEYIDASPQPDKGLPIDGSFRVLSWPAGGGTRQLSLSWLSGPVRVRRDSSPARSTASNEAEASRMKQRPRVE